MMMDIANNTQKYLLVFYYCRKYTCLQNFNIICNVHHNKKCRFIFIFQKIYIFENLNIICNTIASSLRVQWESRRQIVDFLIKIRVRLAKSGPNNIFCDCCQNKKLLSGLSD
jgi:hypothetical protein